jgi:hypothetical protein
MILPPHDSAKTKRYDKSEWQNHEEEDWPTNKGE